MLQQDNKKNDEATDKKLDPDSLLKSTLFLGWTFMFEGKKASQNTPAFPINLSAFPVTSNTFQSLPH